MIIHLDLDGVLADFETGFKKHTGRAISSFTSNNEFWKFAQTFDHLYADLPMMHDAPILISAVRRISVEYGFQVEILTALPSVEKMPHAEKDKEAWVRKNCPYGWKFKVGPHAVDKQKHAKPGEILIDDKARNIAQWQEAGGIGIWHSSAASSVRQLKNMFKI
jgi:hypothetical protein